MPGEILEANIEKLVYGGEGLARVEGRVVLARYVLPGERVRLEPESEKPGLLRARPRLIVDPSAHRVTPRCEHFMRCGGCDYQHSDYAYQLDQKVAILAEVLQRVGKFSYDGKVAVIAGPEWSYRNRIQLHFMKGKLGFHAAGSHKMAQIRSCPISSPKLNEAITAMVPMAGDRRWPDFLQSLELFTNEHDVQVNVLEASGKRLAKPFFDWLAEAIPGAEATAVEYPTGAGAFRVSHKSFFQTNRFLIDALVTEVTANRAGESAWDLYSGVGLFSMGLAKTFGRVTGVESSAAASNDLAFNAARMGVTVENHHMPAEEFLAGQSVAPDFVLADPPRAGLDKAVTGHLLRLAPKRITIVSCDPSTMARDLAVLLRGGYEVERMALIDLFPHTAHLETITHLVKRD